MPRNRVLWASFVVVGLLLLDVLDATAYGIVVPVAAAALWLVVRSAAEERADRVAVDGRDLSVMAGLYVAVVTLFRVAFSGFGTERVAGLFITFAAGLLLGVAGPVVYSVWVRQRPLATLGLTPERLPATAALALLFAVVQFALTLWGYELPDDRERWVPLLVMSLVVGFFEAVFFRGFLQGLLDSMFGPGPAVGLASALYALYHVGYGMGADEIVFLFGLGVVYAIAYAIVRNVLVLWPLLTPLGAFYNNVDAGDIDLPWASIIGFAEVGIAMGVVVWLALRYERRRCDVPALAASPPQVSG